MGAGPRFLGSFSKAYSAGTTNSLESFSRWGAAGHALLYVDTTANSGTWKVIADIGLGNNTATTQQDTPPNSNGTPLTAGANITTTGLTLEAMFPFYSGLTLSGKNTAVPMTNLLDFQVTNSAVANTIDADVYVFEAPNPEGGGAFLLTAQSGLTGTVTVDIDDGPKGCAAEMVGISLSHPQNTSPTPTSDWDVSLNKRMPSGDVIVIATNAITIAGAGATPLRLDSAFEDTNLAIPFPDQVVFTKNSGDDLDINVYVFAS